jgi:hypothetical protein
MALEAADRTCCGAGFVVAAVGEASQPAGPDLPKAHLTGRCSVTLR